MLKHRPGLLFISMTDQANGAENVWLMAAVASRSPIIFLKRTGYGSLNIPSAQRVIYLSDKSILLGALKLIFVLRSFPGVTAMSTHSFLNAWAGFLKRIHLFKGTVVVRECTSVFSRYSGFKKWLYRMVYRIGYKGVDMVVCQTHEMRAVFLQNVRLVASNHVIVQDNPVDFTQIKEMAQKLIVDPDISDQPFICAAGRLIPEKGFDILIQAFSLIEQQYPHLKLFIFGDGSEKQALNKLIRFYGLQHKIILKGWISNPLPYFKKARVCVVSSVKEGFPNVLLQMMALNSCVISTLCAGGIEDIPGIYKAQVNNANSLANQLKIALSNDYCKEPHLAANYFENRTPSKFVSSILERLNDVSESSSPY
jgi:glycosyltransferase involved in cell wall biosynthesis